MRVLRLRHSLTAGGGSLVAVDYDPGHGASGFTSRVPFLLELTGRDRSRLRFYLESFHTCPDPAALAPVAALQVDLRRWGEELFRQVFRTDRKALFHYQEASRDLPTLRIEVLADHPGAWAVPWELLYDPDLGWLAPQARSFARGPIPGAGERGLSGWVPRPGEPLRVLYVVGRPAGSLEIPFHSVARALLEGAAEMGERLRIDVLRPPTFERLAQALREAMEAGRPYHVLHFDGHGVFTDSPLDYAGELDRRPLNRRRGGARGYLMFEDPEGREEARRPVDGVQIGNLVGRTRTPLVVLHACQSAAARIAAAQRWAAGPPGPRRRPASPLGETPDDHDQDLAFQSVAAEIMRFGPRAVVALPWTLPPATAAGLLSRLYGRIAEGIPVGEAVGALRCGLRQEARRESLLGTVEVDDWLVPLVHEPEPLPVCDPGRGWRGWARAVPEEPRVAAELPAPPGWGFVERPGVLFTLDRAFDAHGTVLLHALAGAGKTCLARELALWYRQSGGLGEGGGTEPGAVLWSSFESYQPAAPFDVFEHAFADRLQRGRTWTAAGREERRSIALEVLRELPAFWVWDCVERLGGSPPGSEPLWPEEERRFLADLLRDLSETRCRVLLVGRSPEEEWLGDLPRRVALPPMPAEERAELAMRIAARHGLALRELTSFAPLLELSQGNPRTLVLLLDETLRKGCRTRQEVEAFLSEILDLHKGRPEEGAPERLGPGTEEPLPVREELWEAINGYVLQLAGRERG